MNVPSLIEDQKIILGVPLKDRVHTHAESMRSSQFVFMPSESNREPPSAGLAAVTGKPPLSQSVAAVKSSNNPPAPAPATPVQTNQPTVDAGGSFVSGGGLSQSAPEPEASSQVEVEVAAEEDPEVVVEEVENEGLAASAAEEGAEEEMAEDVEVADNAEEGEAEIVEGEEGEAEIEEVGEEGEAEIEEAVEEEGPK